MAAGTPCEVTPHPLPPPRSPQAFATEHSRVLRVGQWRIVETGESTSFSAMPDVLRRSTKEITPRAELALLQGYSRRL